MVGMMETGMTITARENLDTFAKNESFISCLMVFWAWEVGAL